MLNQRIKKHGIICFSIFLALTVIALFSSSVHLGFFGYIAFLISGTFFTTIGVSIGDAFRRFTMPDAILTSGAGETFKAKIFWAIGPQAIGFFLGWMATNGFMTNFLGIPI